MEKLQLCGTSCQLIWIKHFLFFKYRIFCTTRIQAPSLSFWQSSSLILEFISCIIHVYCYYISFFVIDISASVSIMFMYLHQFCLFSFLLLFSFRIVSSANFIWKFQSVWRILRGKSLGYPRRALKIFRDAWSYRNELITLRRKGLCPMFFETSDSFFRLIFISAILSFGLPRSLRKHSIHVIANICCSFCLLSPSHTIDLRLLLRMIVLHIS